MILLSDFKKVDEEKLLVGSRYYALDNLTDVKDILGNNREYILIDKVPEEMSCPNKNSQLYVNPKTKEAWYEYEEIQKSNDDMIKETIEKLQKDNAQLLKENVRKDAIIESLSKDIADIYKMVGGNK